MSEPTTMPVCECGDPYDPYRCGECGGCLAQRGLFYVERGVAHLSLWCPGLTPWGSRAAGRCPIQWEPLCGTCCATQALVMCECEE